MKTTASQSHWFFFIEKGWFHEVPELTIMISAQNASDAINVLYPYDLSRPH